MTGMDIAPHGLFLAMALSVHVFIGGGVGEPTILDTPPDVSCAAGFESWRSDIWGSERVRSLGAEFFPRLAGDDLYVEHAQLAQFRRECELLRENLDIVAAGPDPLNPQAISFELPSRRVIKPADPHAAFLDLVSQRLANIESAVRYALKVGGGVVIW